MRGGVYCLGEAVHQRHSYVILMDAVKGSRDLSTLAECGGWWWLVAVVSVVDTSSCRSSLCPCVASTFSFFSPVCRFCFSFHCMCAVDVFSLFACVEFLCGMLGDGTFISHLTPFPPCQAMHQGSGVFSFCALHPLLSLISAF